MTTKTKNKLYGIGNALLSELFPDRCAICDKLLDSGKCICDDCNDSFSRQPRKFYSGKTLCYSVCEYSDVNKKIVLGAKKGRDFYKLSFMATEIYELLKNNGVMDEIEVIVPAPMSLAKRLKKGFNHTEKLTRHISYLSGIDTVKAVKKIRETSEQKTLSREERMKNLKGSFAMSKRKAVSGKTVLLVDDVTTTGSTLSEVAEVLRKAGNEVICAVFARTPYKENDTTE